MLLHQRQRERRVSGFLYAAICFFVGVLIAIPAVKFLDSLTDYAFATWPQVGLLLPIILPLVPGVCFLMMRRWRAFQGWLLGFVAVLILLAVGLYVFARNFHCCF